MLERLKIILEKRDFSDWKIKMREENSRQLFYIGKKVEVSRSVSVLEADVTVYMDYESEEGRQRGSATAGFHPSMTDSEIESKLDFLHKAAASAPNPWYPLPEKGNRTGRFSGDRDYSDGSLADWAVRLGATLYSADTRKESWINSAEIFLTEIRETLADSRGAELNYSGFEGLLDLVTTARDRAGNEAELHSEKDFSAWEPEELKDHVTKQLIHTEDRIKAEPMPVMECPRIILQGEALRRFFGYWVGATSGESVYRQIHTTQPGEVLFPGSGDRVSLSGLDRLRNDPLARPYDDQGILLKELEILKEGKLMSYHVGQQFAHYMNRPATGKYLCFSVGAGSLDRNEMYKGTCLEIIAFSDFQMNDITGDFGGEIRLAYLWKNGVKKALTGGSVTGALARCAPSMKMSREVSTEGHLLCPLAVSLEGLNLTGTE